MKKINKRNKGITLVALVITIVILLILAGISIAQLTGNGLFKNAKLAKEMSDNAQQKENDTLSDYESKIGEYIDGTRNENTNVYSENEKVIGTWIDGNTIYSKVIDLGYSFPINKTNTNALESMIPEDIYLPIKSIFYVIDDTNKAYGYDVCNLWKISDRWRYVALDAWDSSATRHVYFYVEYTKLTSD